MSDPIFNENEQKDSSSEAEAAKEQRENLKKRATMLGISFAQNTPSAKLAEMIEEYLTAESSDDAEPSKEEEQKTLTSTNDIRKEANRLIRVRVTCHNPAKQQLEGEVFTVANRFIGTVSKYVPFGEKTQNGFHIEKCIYDHMKSRTYLHIDSREDPRSKRIRTKTKDALEFTLEVLPPLTKQELKVLADDQRVRGAVED